jgi:serine/threonine-protein kinase
MSSTEAGQYFGKYRLLRRLAFGGMAEIYLALHEGPHGFEQIVVLKLILEQYSTNQSFVQMFLDEARIAANLQHTNVVRLYDFGEHEGRYFLSMEYLPGEDLGTVLQVLQKTQRQFPIALACELVRAAANGLHSAHELTDARGNPLRVVHRDVTPSNLMVTYQGVLKVLDFGIARAESNVTQTDAGVVKGKLAYCSPEQIAAERIDARSDIFSLGLVLHELLTGLRLFKRESDLMTMKAVIEAPITPPSEHRTEVPSELDAIVLKAVTRQVDQRYATMAEFSDDLGHFLVTIGHHGSERVTAEFLTGLFGAARREKRLKIADPDQASDLARRPISTSSPSLATHEKAARDEAATTAVPLGPSRTSRPPVALVAAVGVATIAVFAMGFALTAPRPAASFQPMGLGTLARVAVVTPVVPQAAPAVVDAGVASLPDAGAHPAVVARARKGKLTLDTQPWAEVFLKGRKLGDTPLVDLPLAAGTYSLTLVNEAKNLRTVIEVEVEDNKTTVKRLRF